MLRLNHLLATLPALVLYGCGTFFGDSYEEDVSNDREIINEIIKTNPILDSAKEAGHFFLPYSGETGKITGELDLHNLNLTDSNFHFPASIRNFRKVNTLLISSNDFTELPRGTRNANWKSVLVLANRICNPSSETIKYLDALMADAPGGYWRDSQRCTDSIPAVLP